MFKALSSVSALPATRLAKSRIALRIPYLGAAAVVAVLGLASPARADVFDGGWCHDDARRLSIRRPTIVTPGGATLQGDYTRHSFQYTVPPNEAGSGQPVSLILRSETRVDVRVARQSGLRNSTAPGLSHRDVTGTVRNGQLARTDP
jgi:hypothetical protein